MRTYIRLYYTELYKCLDMCKHLALCLQHDTLIYQTLMNMWYVHMYILYDAGIANKNICNILAGHKIYIRSHLNQPQWPRDTAVLNAFGLFAITSLDFWPRTWSEENWFNGLLLFFSIFFNAKFYANVNRIKIIKILLRVEASTGLYFYIIGAILKWLAKGIISFKVMCINICIKYRNIAF